MKIDLEKLICSFLECDLTDEQKIRADEMFKKNRFVNAIAVKWNLVNALKEQGIEYKDDKLTQIESQQEFDKINISNHLCHHSEESADHQEKVFVYHTPQTSLPLSKEVHYMLVDKDLSSLLKQLCKETSSLQGHELHSYLSYLAGVFEGSARQRQQKIEQQSDNGI